MDEVTTRPTGRQKAAAWIAIVLGLMTCCGGALAVGGQAINMSDSMAEFQKNSAAGDPYQIQMQEEMQEITDDWKWFSLPMALLMLPVALGLFVAGGMLLTMRARATQVAIVALCSFVALQVLAGVTGVLIGTKTLGVVASTMEEMMQSMGGSGSDVELVLKTMRITMIAGIGIALGWTGIKIVTAAVGLRLVLKPGATEGLEEARE